MLEVNLHFVFVSPRSFMISDTILYKKRTQVHSVKRYTIPETCYIVNYIYFKSINNWTYLISTGVFVGFNPVP